MENKELIFKKLSYPLIDEIFYRLDDIGDDILDHNILIGDLLNKTFEIYPHTTPERLVMNEMNGFDLIIMEYIRETGSFNIIRCVR